MAAIGNLDGGFSSGRLKRHQGSHEFKDKGLVMKCTECGKKLSARRSFVEHVSKVHKGLKIEPEIVPAENGDPSVLKKLDSIEAVPSEPILPNKYKKSLKIGLEITAAENDDLIDSKKLENKEIVQSSMTPMESKPNLSEFKRGMWIVKLDKMAS